MTTAIALVLGLSPTGLYVVRELGREHIPVHAISDSHQCGHFSRHLAKAAAIEEDDDRQLAWLTERVAECGGAAVIFPTADRYIELIQQNALDLADHCMFFDCYATGASAALLDKASFAALCDEHGIDQPRVWERSVARLSELTSAIHFPCLLKPRQIHRVKAAMNGRKLFVVHDRADFRELVSRLPKDASDWLVQELVPGPESEITLFGAYFDRQGRCHQSFTARKLRQYPPGFGSASLVLSADLPETRSVSEAFLRAIKFRGIAGAEFKLDRRDGKLKIIEINPRVTLWFAAAQRAGKQIAYAAFQDLIGGSLPEDIPQRQGIVWRYFWKDAYSASFYRLFGRSFSLPPPELSGALNGKTERVGAVHDWADPGPTVGEALTYLRKFSIRRFLPRNPAGDLAR